MSLLQHGTLPAGGVSAPLMNFRGPWLPSVTYVQNDVVIFQPIFNSVFYAPPDAYVCVVASSNHSTWVASDWSLLFGQGLNGSLTLLNMGSTGSGSKVLGQGAFLSGQGLGSGAATPLTFGTGNGQVNVNAATCGTGFVAAFPNIGNVSGVSGAVTITPGTSPAAGILFSIKIQNGAANPNFTLSPQVKTGIQAVGATPGGTAYHSAVSITANGWSFYYGGVLSAPTTFTWLVIGNG